MKFIFLSLFAFAAATGFSEIQTIRSFEEAEEKIASLTEESLAIFDVDEVLVTPSDLVLKPTGGTFNPDYLNVLSEKERDDLLSVMLNGTEYVLVDPNAPAILAKLAERKVNAIALTACRTGFFGVIPSMENWRCGQLNRVNIDLSASFFKGTECIFPESTGGKPIFKNGILFCGDFSHSKKSSKGELLGIFLDNMEWSPDEIVFFDDQMKNLLSVQEEAEKRGIPYQGYLFETDSSDSLDEKIAEFQFQTALKEKKWLSDKEAKMRLQERIPLAVVFDWGNVLAVNSRDCVVDFLCETFQLNQEEFEKTNHKKRLAVKTGQTDVGFWIWYAAQNNIDLPSDWPAIYDAVIQKSIGADPEMFALVEELKGKKVRVGLLSNIDDRYTGLIRKYGYYEPFEPCILSCEIGLSKPDPQIYEHLLQEMKIPSQKIVFIDDLEDNVEAAKKLGIDAILFQSSDKSFI